MLALKEVLYGISVVFLSARFPGRWKEVHFGADGRNQAWGSFKHVRRSPGGNDDCGNKPRWSVCVCVCVCGFERLRWRTNNWGAAAVKLKCFSATRFTVDGGSQTRELGGTGGSRPPTPPRQLLVFHHEKTNIYIQLTLQQSWSIKIYLA